MTLKIFPLRKSRPASGAATTKTRFAGLKRRDDLRVVRAGTLPCGIAVNLLRRGESIRTVSGAATTKTRYVGLKRRDDLCVVREGTLPRGMAMNLLRPGDSNRTVSGAATTAIGGQSLFPQHRSGSVVSVLVPRFPGFTNDRHTCAHLPLRSTLFHDLEIAARDRFIRALLNQSR
jgi:hypothetical protein